MSSSIQKQAILEEQQQRIIKQKQKKKKKLKGIKNKKRKEKKKILKTKEDYRRKRAEINKKNRDKQKQQEIQRERKMLSGDGSEFQSIEPIIAEVLTGGIELISEGLEVLDSLGSSSEVETPLIDLSEKAEVQKELPADVNHKGDEKKDSPSEEVRQDSQAKKQELSFKRKMTRSLGPDLNQNSEGNNSAKRKGSHSLDSGLSRKPKEKKLEENKPTRTRKPIGRSHP